MPRFLASLLRAGCVLAPGNVTPNVGDSVPLAPGLHRRSQAILVNPSMDTECFDTFARSLTDSRSRRGTLAAVLRGRLCLAGLASFLADALGRGPRRVIVEPFVFSGASKSERGWDFLGLIDGGRFKVYADDGDELTRVYRHQMAACTYEVFPGPGRLLPWSVPAGRGHDDLLVSAALTARLDRID